MNKPIHINYEKVIEKIEQGEGAVLVYRVLLEDREVSPRRWCLS